MKAKDLKVWQEFKLPGQRKFRKAINICVLMDNGHVPKHDVGKILIIYDECRQMVLDPEHEIIINVSNPFLSNTTRNMRKITVILGPLGSGKTTMARKLAEGKKAVFVNGFTISRTASEFCMVRGTELVVIEEVVTERQFHDIISSGKLIGWDKLHITPSYPDLIIVSTHLLGADKQFFQSGVGFPCDYGKCEVVYLLDIVAISNDAT